MMEKFFAGRLNRKQFIIRNLILVIVMTLLILVGTFAGIASSPELQGPVYDEAKLIEVLTPFICVMALLSGLVSFSLDVRRFHDLGYSGKFAIIPLIMNLLLCIPAVGTSALNAPLSVISMAIFAYLVVAKGDSGTNSFGEEP